MIMFHVIRSIRTVHTKAALSQVAATPDQFSDNQFVTGPNPYLSKKEQCILCKYKIKVDYKNPRLLSQFVSPLTGTLYEKHITGLCTMQQILLSREIKKSKHAMLMPLFYRDPKYNKDPQLFNPDRPKGKKP